MLIIEGHPQKEDYIFIVIQILDSNIYLFGLSDIGAISSCVLHVFHISISTLKFY